MFDDADTFDIDVASGVKKTPGKAAEAKPADSGNAAGSDLGLGSAIDFDTTPSGLDLESGAGSALDLTSENEDLVLGERSDSDVTRDPGSSGISLANPDQSGVSLEDDSVDVQLGGSAVDSFELGEDDAVAAGSGPLKADDDFLLEPLATDDDEAESGSQVIALAEDEEGFEAAGVPGAALVADEDEPGTVRVGAAPAAYAEAPDAVYTGWSVAGLACCVVLLLFCGMFAYDLLRNMWSWGETYSVNSGMIETVAGWMGWKFK
jgi:hypothetical protein